MELPSISLAQPYRTLEQTNESPLGYTSSINRRRELDDVNDDSLFDITLDSQTYEGPAMLFMKRKRQLAVRKLRREEETLELPQVSMKTPHEVQNSCFFKKYRQKNPIHEIDRERSASILSNLSSNSGSES